MEKKRNNSVEWKGKNGRTKSITWWWDRRGSLGKWWLIPTIRYEHVFDPLSIEFHFLKFNIRYHSVMRYTGEEFKTMLKEKGMDVSSAQPGYFEL